MTVTLAFLVASVVVETDAVAMIGAEFPEIHLNLTATLSCEMQRSSFPLSVAGRLLRPPIEELLVVGKR